MSCGGCSSALCFRSCASTSTLRQCIYLCPVSNAGASYGRCSSGLQKLSRVGYARVTNRPRLGLSSWNPGTRHMVDAGCSSDRKSSESRDVFHYCLVTLPQGDMLLWLKSPREVMSYENTPQLLEDRSNLSHVGRLATLALLRGSMMILYTSLTVLLCAIASFSACTRARVCL